VADRWAMTTPDLDRPSVAPDDPSGPARGGCPPPRITVISGGLGGARLALVLQAAGLERQCCFVTNVGDDCETDGLLVCPDTDAVLYALGGVFDDDRGWGIRGDVFPAAPEAEWFHVGHRDRETHVMRDALLRDGSSLTDVTARLAHGLGVEARTLPASHDALRTYVHTPQGVLEWQEWLVREQGRPPVQKVEYRGVADARATPEVRQAITEASLLIIAASSPVASIGPTLALPGVADWIRARRRPTVALSPVTRRRPLVNERDTRRAAARAALLAAAGIEHDPVAIARHYADLIDAYVLDEADAADVEPVARLGIEPLVAPLIDRGGGNGLVATLLAFSTRADGPRRRGKSSVVRCRAR
jgi:LPPG:FO 2-phospho-L-lactate transferase